MITKRIKGKWRIVEMPMWDADHLNLLGHAYIEFDGKGGGEIVFGALQATLECATTPSGVDFDWYGFDEMDEVRGEGLVELQDDHSLIGEFAYHNGDESDLRAVPW